MRNHLEQLKNFANVREKLSPRKEIFMCNEKNLRKIRFDTHIDTVLYHLGVLNFIFVIVFILANIGYITYCQIFKLPCISPQMILISFKTLLIIQIPLGLLSTIDLFRKSCPKMFRKTVIINIAAVLLYLFYLAILMFALQWGWIQFRYQESTKNILSYNVPSPSRVC